MDLRERGYDITVGAAPGAPRSLAGRAGARALLVSDSRVDPLYGDVWAGMLGAAGVEAVRAVLPAGEGSKTLAWAGRLYEAAAGAGLDRRGLVVALGGGVVGDLAGFVAGTYLRGVDLVQAPTTLLAMVDSAVGGKTAVNLPQGKNLVGVFHQPVEVLADLSTLSTLPDREYVSGLAEVVKCGAIWDATFFDRLEAGAERLRAREPGMLEAVVVRCCEIKAEVVAMDERESGVRAVLNFGHTLAHALEQAAGYGAWLHGEAVAVGMAYAAELSARERGLPAAERDRLVGLLRRLGLPVRADAAGAPAPWADARRAMGADKKSRGGAPRFVLAQRLGSVVFGCRLDEQVLEDAYASLSGPSAPAGGGRGAARSTG